MRNAKFQSNTIHKSSPLCSETIAPKQRTFVCIKNTNALCFLRPLSLAGFLLLTQYSGRHTGKSLVSVSYEREQSFQHSSLCQKLTLSLGCPCKGSLLVKWVLPVSKQHREEKDRGDRHILCGQGKQECLVNSLFMLVLATETDKVRKENWKLQQLIY